MKRRSKKKALAISGIGLLLVTSVSWALSLAFNLAMETGDIDVSGIVNTIMTQAMEAIANIDWPDITISVNWPATGTPPAP